MKRPSYKRAIEWIALNDGAGDDDALDTEAVGNLVSSVLVADIFEVDSDKVGQDVVKLRKTLQPPPMTAKEAITRSVRSGYLVSLEHTPTLETELRDFLGENGSETTRFGQIEFHGMWEGGHEWDVHLRLPSKGN
jgi:hypothetical protein